MDNFKPELTKIKIVKTLSPCKISVLYNFPESRLQEVETEIGKSWEVASTFCYCKTKPSPSMFVAVREGNGMYKRGFVESVVASVAQVFLCDYGISVVIEDLDKMMPLKDEHQYKLAFYSTAIVIPGLVPARVMKLSTGEKVMSCSNWSVEANSVVKAWLTDAEVAITVFKFQSPALTYGDFYKKTSKNALSTVLCERKLALVDQEKFDMVIFRDAVTAPAAHAFKSRKSKTPEQQVRLMEREIEEMKSTIDRLTIANMEKDKRMESGHQLMLIERNQLQEELQKYKDMLAAKHEEMKSYMARQNRRQN